MYKQKIQARSGVVVQRRDPLSQEEQDRGLAFPFQNGATGIQARIRQIQVTEERRQRTGGEGIILPERYSPFVGGISSSSFHDRQSQPLSGNLSDSTVPIVPPSSIASQLSGRATVGVQRSVTDSRGGQVAASTEDRLTFFERAVRGNEADRAMVVERMLASFGAQ